MSLSFSTIPSAVGTITDGTNDSNQFSFGRTYHPRKLTMKPSSNSTTLSSFSTSFVFSVLPEIASSPGFGLCFVLTNFWPEIASTTTVIVIRTTSISVKAVDRRKFICEVETVECNGEIVRF
ncbi:hypothetical protein Ddye_009152 [Dipteronia dyeriana]|uniref:Legume lectin domain-containing protein n=1 Tax=Dipteronia dyeriana TaxID=168575 RepID=A0AAD9XAU7_9ROSI|nr:hypothetical protein Ddye_009152 [Dipteronia dyeriana]